MQLLRKVLFTPEGKDELVLEVACLEQLRRDILKGAADSPSGGNNNTNFELQAVDSQLSRLKDVLSTGEVTDQTGLIVAVGSEVTVAGNQGEETFTIGGPLVASHRARCISYESPLAQAVLGHELGETVEVCTAGQTSQVKIVSIRRGRPGSIVC